MKREVTIGIEIHCELKTKTKMFSGAPLGFADAPNTNVNEIDLGHPGTLPSLNKEAVKLSIMACAIMDCSIDRLMRFDRKNYFYSDLPKGFQITQQFYPLGSDGRIIITTEDGDKVIRIDRIHMEEDTAKQFHHDAETLIDYNRAGTPLIEIVSKPDITSAKEARLFVETLRNRLLYANISDVKMEEGSLRCDVNISLKEPKATRLGTKVEIKNLNSIANIERAIEAEIIRQNKLLDENKPVKQQTRRYDEATKTTVAMRSKEGSLDYRYFPEPNIFPTRITDDLFEAAMSSIPMMPDEKRMMLISVYDLRPQDVEVLINNKRLLDYFDEIIPLSKHPKLVSNWLLGDVLAINHQEAYNKLIRPDYFAEFIDLIAENKINSKQAKLVFEHMLAHKKPSLVIEELNLSVVNDSFALMEWINEAIEKNPQSIIDYKNGKSRAVGFLVGQVMKLSKGKADPALTNQMVQKELDSR